MLWGSAAISMALCVQALAQSTTLPQVTVEGKAQKQKGATKGAPKAAPTQPVEQAQPVQTQEATEKAQKDAIYKTPAAVSTATKSDIDTFGQVDVGDVIRSMPGTFTRESPQNTGIAVNIRGMGDAGRVNMMIDGVRQNFRFTGHEAMGFAYVDPALLAGIDIMRGAVTTVGGGALVGSVNLKTLGVEDIIKPGKQTGLMTSTTYGTNGVGWQQMVAGGATAGGVGIAGAFSHKEPDRYMNGDGTKVLFTDQALTSGLFKMNFALTSEMSLKLGAVTYDNDLFANSYFQNVLANTYTVKYAYTPKNNPLVDFAFNAYANEVKMHYFYDAPPNPPLGSAAGRVLEDHGKGFDVSNTSRFKFGDMKVTAIYGYESFFDDVDASNKITPASAAGANPSGKANISGLFSQTTFSYGIVDLIAGGRFDTYSLEGAYDADGTGPGTVLVPVDKSANRFSPKVTLAANVTPWLQPYVTYAEAFRAPNINETLFGGSHPLIGGQPFAPNPFLEPEIQKGWEFGFNVRQNGIFSSRDFFRLKAGYYAMDVENFIIACSTGNPVGIAGSFFCNAPGKSKVDGVEVEGMYDTGYAFVGFSYTYTHNDLPSTLNSLGAATFTPEHVAVGTFGMRFLEQKLTVGTRVSFFSDTFVGEPNVGLFYSSPFMPGYTLVDLFASYKLDQNIELGITAMNLFDVSYTPALSTAVIPNGPITPQNCFGSNLAGCSDSGRGRTVLVSVKTHW